MKKARETRGSARPRSGASRSVTAAVAADVTPAEVAEGEAAVAEEVPETGVAEDVGEVPEGVPVAVGPAAAAARPGRQTAAVRPGAVVHPELRRGAGLVVGAVRILLAEGEGARPGALVVAVDVDPEPGVAPVAEEARELGDLGERGRAAR